MIDYPCYGCRKTMSSPESLVGQPEVCPDCGAMNLVPAVHFRCLRCKTALSAPIAKAGAPMRCPKCDLLQSIPRVSGKSDAARLSPSATSEGQHCNGDIHVEFSDEPATERQLGYARAIGLDFDTDITKDEVGLLLTYYERNRHYFYGLWIHLAGDSATVTPDGSEYVKKYAAAVVNQQRDVAQEISDLVGDDGQSEEFLVANVELRDGFSRDFMAKFQTYSGRRFPSC